MNYRGKLPTEVSGFPLSVDFSQENDSVQSFSQVRLFGTPWTAARQASLSITNSQSLLKLMFRVGDAIQPSHPLSSPSPPTFSLPQHHSLFQWVSSSHWWPKYWSFSFSISPSNEYSGPVSFMIDWFDLAVQETLKSHLQDHSSKASILWHSAFFIVQLPHPCYWKNHSFH